MEIHITKASEVNSRMRSRFIISIDFNNPNQ